MKPIKEVRFWLCALSVISLMKIDGNSVPTGWPGLVCLALLILAGIWLGCRLTDFLIVFKKWWRE